MRRWGGRYLPKRRAALRSSSGASCCRRVPASRRLQRGGGAPLCSATRNLLNVRQTEGKENQTRRNITNQAWQREKGTHSDMPTVGRRIQAGPPSARSLPAVAKPAHTANHRPPPVRQYGVDVTPKRRRSSRNRCGRVQTRNAASLPAPARPHPRCAATRPASRSSAPAMLPSVASEGVIQAQRARQEVSAQQHQNTICCGNRWNEGNIKPACRGIEGGTYGVAEQRGGNGTPSASLIAGQQIESRYAVR